MLGVGRAGAAGSPIIAGFLFTWLGNDELLTVSTIMSIGAIVGYYAAFARGFPAYARATGTGFVLGVGRAGAAGSPIIAGFLFTWLGNDELLTVSAIMSIGAIIGAGLIWMLPMRDADREADERAAT